MDGKVKERLLKILELSKNGIDGEKESATKLLFKLAEKHGISIEDLDSERIEEFTFKYSNKYEEKLILQILYATVSVSDSEFHYYRVKGKKIIGFELTKAQYIQVCHLFDIYKKALKKHFNIAYKAFIMRNNIYSKCGANREMSDDDYKAAEIARKIEATIVYRAIDTSAGQGSV